MVQAKLSKDLGETMTGLLSNFRNTIIVSFVLAW
jgi:hypothetical protein